MYFFLMLSFLFRYKDGGNCEGIEKAFLERFMLEKRCDIFRVSHDSDFVCESASALKFIARAKYELLIENMTSEMVSES